MEQSKHTNKKQRVKRSLAGCKAIVYGGVKILFVLEFKPGSSAAARFSSCAPLCKFWPLRIAENPQRALCGGGPGGGHPLKKVPFKRATSRVQKGPL